ncbi:hypothetical protein OXX59_006717 [Metschnikowia pulcherrima]
MVVRGTQTSSNLVHRFLPKRAFCDFIDAPQLIFRYRKECTMAEDNLSQDTNVRIIARGEPSVTINAETNLSGGSSAVIGGNKRSANDAKISDNVSDSRGTETGDDFETTSTIVSPKNAKRQKLARGSVSVKLEYSDLEESEDEQEKLTSPSQETVSKTQENVNEDGSGSQAPVSANGESPSSVDETSEEHQKAGELEEPETGGISTLAQLPVSAPVGGQTGHSTTVIAQPEPNISTQNMDVTGNGGERPYTCTICLIGYASASALIVHLNTHIEETPQCPVCNENLAPGSSLPRHMRTHKQDVVFQCTVCDESFITQDALAEHDKTHTEPVFACAECGKTYDSEKALNLHEKTHAEDEYTEENNDHQEDAEEHEQDTFECDECGEEFLSKTHLKLHVRTHTGEKPYECSKCTVKFSSRSAYQRHLRNHTGKRQFQCTVCQKQLSSKDNWEYHMRTHTGEKLFECEVCGRKMSTKYRLADHMNIHTGKKPYQCKVCGLAFAADTNLFFHMKHHESGKLQCKVCRKWLRSQEDMDKHMKNHEKDLKFQCQVCQKRLSSNTHLKQHMTLHTGESPYKCHICQKCMTAPSALKRHMKTHFQESFFKAPESRYAVKKHTAGDDPALR